MSGGFIACRARAKRPPNRSTHALEKPGKNAAGAVASKRVRKARPVCFWMLRVCVFAGSGAQLPHPAASHASDLVNFADDKNQLLLADPVLIMHQSPEHAQEFELQVQFCQQRPFAGRRGVNGAHAQEQRIQGHVVEPLAEGEAVAFRKIPRALEGPAGQLGEQSVNRGFFMVIHLKIGS